MEYKDDAGLTILNSSSNHSDKLLLNTVISLMLKK